MCKWTEEFGCSLWLCSLWHWSSLVPLTHTLGWGPLWSCVWLRGRWNHKVASRLLWAKNSDPSPPHLNCISWNFLLSPSDPSLVPALPLQQGVWRVLSWSSLQAQHQGALPWGSLVLPDKVDLAGAGVTNPLPACKPAGLILWQWYKRLWKVVTWYMWLLVNSFPQSTRWNQRLWFGLLWTGKRILLILHFL